MHILVIGQFEFKKTTTVVYSDIMDSFLMLHVVFFIFVLHLIVEADKMNIFLKENVLNVGCRLSLTFLTVVVH